MEAVVVVALATLVTLVKAENGLVNEVSDTCILSVSNESRAIFTETILKHDYNFMYMQLHFEDMNTTVKSNRSVILAKNWIWTYKGEDGGHNYLFLPQDFGYLSFGLLWSKSNASVHPIRIQHKGDCSQLTIGHRASDQLIGNALGNMTSEIADRKERYNSSFWCYKTRKYIEPEIFYQICENTICGFEVIKFICCKYVVNFATRNRSVECSKDHYKLNDLWWGLPILFGGLCFAFYPLFLTNVGSMLQKLTQERSIRRQYSLEEDDNTDHNQEYIRLRHSPPVKLFTTILYPIVSACKCKSSFCLRTLRLLIIIMPMALVALRFYLDWKYDRGLIKEAVEKGAIYGFSSLIAGPRESRRFLRFMGGPYPALVMYVVFGTILILYPNDFPRFLENGLFDPRSNTHFILTMRITLREKLGRISVRHCNGYKKFHNYLLVQLYMILNSNFWQYMLLIYVKRWSERVIRVVKRLLTNKAIATIVMITIFPFYIGFCVIETLFSLLYLSLPVVSCFFIILNAYIKSLNCYFSDKHWLLRIASKIIIAGTVFAFLITFYVYCVMFFDGIWFLSRIIMFTCIGIVQFPKLSYGYIMLAFMAFYYLMDNIRTFGSSYTDLLKLSIEVCEKVQCESSDKFGQDLVQDRAIPSKLFNVIIERHQPKRVKVCSTILKIFSVVTILYLSINLFITFDKLRDLSLVTHMFTVLFICALPKLLGELCLKRIRHKNRKRLRRRIYRTVINYCNRHGLDDSDSEDFGLHSVAGYETINIQSDFPN